MDIHTVTYTMYIQLHAYIHTVTYRYINMICNGMYIRIETLIYAANAPTKRQHDRIFSVNDLIHRYGLPDNSPSFNLFSKKCNL